MKVASRFALGSILLLVPLGAVLVHHVNQVEELAQANRRMAATQIRAAMSSLALIGQVDLMEEYARKHIVTADPDYLAKFSETKESFEVELRSLDAMALSERERATAMRLGRRWKKLLAQLDLSSGPKEGQRHQESPEARLAALQRPFGSLRDRAQAIMAASQEAMAAEAVAATEMTRTAERVSWMVSAVALCLSLVVVFVTVGAINRPLRRLTAATRAVSKGRFAIQLIPSSRDDEISDLTRAFNAMVQRLGELDQMKKDFLSHVSHELKNPLVAMQETNRLMLDELAGPLTAKQKRLLELNLEGGRRLSAMIADILDLSRMEAGATFDLEPRDLIELVGSAVEAFEARALDKKIALRLNMPAGAISLRCDGNRLIQVVQNLLDNAVKFSGEGGEITVEVGTLDEAPQSHYPAPWRERLLKPETRRSFVLISVSDTGAGIPDEDKELVFEKFYQSGQHARRAGRGGVGLGLAICREIVEAHHGVIWATDAEPVGTTIHVLLPRLAAGEAGERVAKPLASSPSDTPDNPNA